MSHRLAVIGFDAQLDGLENVDRVAAAFYLGKPYHSDQHLLRGETKASLYQDVINSVIQASGLAPEQMALIVIDPQQHSDISKSDFLQLDIVPTFIDAITLSAKLTEQLNCAVLMMAAHIAGNPNQQQLATFSYDQQFVAYGETSGVAGVLLANQGFIERHHCYVYSYLTGFATSNDSNQIEQAIKDAFKLADIAYTEVSSLAVSGHQTPSFSQLEQSAIVNVYSNGVTRHISLSCIKSVIGDSAALSDICGFLAIIFALQQRYHSGVNQWLAPPDNQLAAWQNSPFYLFEQSKPVFPSPNGKARNAAFSCMTETQCGHFIVQENNDRAIHQNGFNAHCDLSLFIIRGDKQQTLIEQLAILDQQVHQSTLKSLSQQYYQASLDNPVQPYCLVLIADSMTTLKIEIGLALAGLENAFLMEKDWKTPRGSYLCVTPDSNPRTCFLYPGIGATYLGLGQDLLQLFPAIYPCIEALVSHPDAAGKYQLLYPRSMVRLSATQLKAHDLALRTKLSDIAECGVGYACVFTYLFRELFNVKADFAAGYSMGEVSMFAALNCWKNPGQMSARLTESSTFNQALAGELKTIRALWNMPNNDEVIWESYNIKGNAEQVKSIIQADERVYITLINTPDSLVIAGYPEHCLAVAKRLGVRAMALNVHNAIHCLPAYQQFDKMVALYTLDLAERITTKLYSSAYYLPVPFTQKAIATSIARCLCQPVDFPRMINTLSKQGVNLFIEMGAGRSLGTWVDKIVSNDKEKKTTVAVNAKGANQQLMVTRAVAKMLSAGVTLDLSSYFYGSIIVNNRITND